MEPESDKKQEYLNSAPQDSSSSTILSEYSLEDRFVGCLLGVMAGDILGTPFEGEGRHHMKRMKSLHENYNWSDFAWGKHMGTQRI
jgi:hypothetical protein